MKRMLCLLLGALLLCLGGAATAETTTMTVNDRQMSVTTFGERFPEEIDAAMRNAGFGDARPVCGAIVKCTNLVLDGASVRNVDTALCVAVRDGKRWLVGFNVQKKEWHVTLRTSTALLDWDDFTLTVPDNYDVGYCPDFVFTYPRADGGTEAYAAGQGQEFNAWRVKRYEGLDADGTGVRIESPKRESYYGVNDVTRRQWSRSTRREYTYYGQQLLACGALLEWSTFADFPTTEEQARTVAQSTLDALPENAVLIGGFVRLRKEGSNHSASLGQYYSGTIGILVDGSDAAGEPWYHVNIGGVQGYVSGRYACPAKAYAASRLDLVSHPLPIGTVTQDCQLMDASDGEGFGALEAGTLLQVMAAVGEDWLRVTMTPVGRVMQADAVTGYVPRSVVSLPEGV